MGKNIICVLCIWKIENMDRKLKIETGVLRLVQRRRKQSTLGRSSENGHHKKARREPHGL